jgi:BASS family bile acid:Na+ symporter
MIRESNPPDVVAFSPLLNRITTLFPLWAVLLSAFAYAVPAPLVALKGAISPLLGVVMLAMGLTLTAENFRLVLRRPLVVAAGVTLQFVLMPLLGWLIARALSLPVELAAGVILVGCCPGGTASNVITYLARGDVALSITLTASSTLLAVVMTPLLALLYVGQSVDVPAWDMLLSVLQIVLVPVLVGTLVNSYVGRRLDRLQRLLPLISVAAIVLIIGIIVAQNQARLAKVGATVLLAVALHNASGLASGYALARLLRFDTGSSRTLAIEIGMQNSGLGVVLATQYFSALAALPGALFSIWHNLTGSLLAGYWSRRSSEPPSSR